MYKIKHTIATNQAVVFANIPGTFAAVAGGVGSIGASERRAALAAVVARCICDEASAVAVIDAALVVQELATEAALAALAVLVGAEVAELARRCCHFVGGALAAIAEAGVGEAGIENPTVCAGEWVLAAALEAPDAERRFAGRARLNTRIVEQVPAVAADPAGVAPGVPAAVLTVVVDAPAAGSGLRARLDPATFAGDRNEAPAGLEHPVGVARQTSAGGPARATAVHRATTVPRARLRRRRRGARCVSGCRGW